MYKLLLVDDEVDVREGLLSEINWEEQGFRSRIRRRMDEKLWS